VLAVIHARGLGPGRTLQLVLTFVKVGAVVAFVVMGFLSEQPPIAETFIPAPVAPSALLLAMVPVMFSYSGWNAAVYIAEEVREPSRNVPLGLAIGTIVVVTLYVSLNALYVLSPARVGVSTASSFSAVAIVIMLSSVSAMTLAGPRVYFAMARDGAFFPAAAHVHVRYRTPAIAITAQAAWSSLLVLSGTFEQLLTYTGFAVILFSGLAVSSLFVSRRRARNPPAFRARGYPWAPGLFCVVSFVIVANAIVTAPGPAIGGLTIILAGLPIHWWIRRTSDTAGRVDSRDESRISRAARRPGIGRTNRAFREPYLCKAGHRGRLHR
jgi:basic amino acid/polyamine antiporter, APA family